MALTESTTLSPWQPTSDRHWDVRCVIHLHRRAGFGANWTDIQRDLKAGPQESVDRILNPVDVDKTHEFEQLSEVIGSAAVAANNISRLQAWWLWRMLRSPDPLAERLTLMWHNHFATSQAKVQDVARMHVQNEIFRAHARAPFAQLLTRTIKDPAMLVWLDADANRREHPNENLAREIMELFTLGAEAFRTTNDAPISHDGYTEKDIQQAARALTGWSTSPSGFRFNAKTHDEGEKSIFGQIGKWDGDGLLRLLLEHSATPRRLAWRLCNEFMGEGCVTDALVSALAEQLSETDLDIGKAVATLLRSEAFFDHANIGSRIVSPVEFNVGAIKSLEIIDPPPSSLLLAEWTARMGQSLFSPPNVFGWSGGRSWLTTRTVISRANFAVNLITGRLHNPKWPLEATRLAKRYGFDSREEHQRFFSLLLHGTESETRAIASRSLEDSVLDLLASPQAQLW